MMETIHCTLLANKTGIYTIYVFKKDNNELVMCTKLPNWGIYNINIGDTGYLTYEIAEAGDKYYDRESGEERIYKFTNIYFKDFIKDTDKNEDKIIL